MKQHIVDICKLTRENTFFRQVVFTGKKSQLVVMNIKPGEDVGEEVHPHTEQTLFFLSGKGVAVLDKVTREISEGDVVVVEPGVKHNFINKGDTPLKIYTIYAPANHIEGRVHQTKEEAEADTADEEFGHNNIQ